MRDMTVPRLLGVSFEVTAIDLPWRSAYRELPLPSKDSHSVRGTSNE